MIKWQNADPVAAEERYRQSLMDHYGRIRIFGTSSEVPLQNVFTDVYIFKEPLSRIPYDFESLRTEMAEEMRPRLRHRFDERTNGMALVRQEGNLFILGKPGAGKTTFLKYLTLQAAQRNLNRLPIFVSLNEWANSAHGKGDDPQLLPFIVRQFEICHFDNATLFVEALLRSGQAMVLFDGLDEVRQEDQQRRKLTQLLKDFARQYDDSQCLVTCRIAAIDYAFAGFRDVEVADFTDEQVNQYAKLWFQTVGRTHEQFVEELTKAENLGVRELCSSPLLLSMVCLYFERVMRFPPNRAELYEDAIEALLNKWDASREILRDEIPQGEILYRELSPRRKEQLFAAIAARTFETGDYFFRRRDLAKWIGDYLRTLPNVKPDDELDNNSVLRAIEAQHGIFVERARDIYSFSHLTFQEYFTARYIFDNERRGATIRLLRDHLNDNRWREIFFLTVSLFDREGADDFWAPSLDFALTCALELVNNTIQDRIRALDLPIQVSIDYELFYAWSYAEFFAHNRWPRNHPVVLNGMVAFAQFIKGIRALAIQASIGDVLNDLTVPISTASPASWQQFADKLHAVMQKRDLIHDWQFTLKSVEQLNAYFYANELLVQCLNVAVVSDRQAILAGLLAPPKKVI